MAMLVADHTAMSVTVGGGMRNKGLKKEGFREESEEHLVGSTLSSQSQGVRGNGRVTMQEAIRGIIRCVRKEQKPEVQRKKARRTPWHFRHPECTCREDLVFWCEVGGGQELSDIWDRCISDFRFGL